VGRPLVLRRAAGRGLRPGRLASWDQAILDAIRAFASGERSEAEVDRVIKIEDARKKSWCKSRARGGRRR